MKKEGLTEAEILHDTVIKKEFCIGCGACASLPDSPFRIEMDKFGLLVARADEERLGDWITPVLKICPFSGLSDNEDTIGDAIFPKSNTKCNKLGNFSKTFAGHVSFSEFRKKGSSGGIAKWIGYSLLKENKIDYFIQLVSNSSGSSSERLFDYKIFEDPKEVLLGSKSCYYPSTLAEVIKIIELNSGRYAITGVPCNIKALRLLSIDSPILQDRISYTIGIVCGGMKSANQSKMIGWQMGIAPENLISIDFRRKYLDRPATQKIYQVWSNKDKEERYENANDLFGTDYGAGLFKPKACDFCDDVVGETADVSVGDAWLPKYRNDPNGNSLIVVRNQVILDLLRSASDKGEVVLTEITQEEAINSQIGGFRHRREGLSYRIGQKALSNEWYPKKRVQANEFKINSKRKYIYALRETLSKKSHLHFLSALEENDLGIFFVNMKPYMRKYFVAVNGNYFQRKIKGIIRRLKL